MEGIPAIREGGGHHGVRRRNALAALMVKIMEMEEEEGESEQDPEADEEAEQK